jgi:hypothetical protein
VYSCSFEGEGVPGVWHEGATSRGSEGVGYTFHVTRGLGYRGAAAGVAGASVLSE